MQVYAAVHDDMSNYLIVRKRYQNRWWGGQSGDSATVNQAGQWALPGGRQDAGETALATARREFLEETGMDLRTVAGVTGSVAIARTHYTVVDFDLSPAQLVNVQLTTNANVQPSGADAGRPAGGHVDDWELQETRIVPAGQLRNFLGVRQPAPPGVRVVVARQPAHTQAIDWYADIATVLRLR